MNFATLLSKLIGQSPKTSAIGLATTGLAIASVFVKDPDTKAGLIAVALALTGTGFRASQDSGTTTTPVVMTQPGVKTGELEAGVETTVKAVEK